jgi:hypothetical protein
VAAARGAIGLVVCLSLAACAPQSPPETETSPPPATTAPPPSWEEQVAAVRTGAASGIEFSGELTEEQFRQLNEGCAGLAVLKLPDAQLDDAQLELLPELLSLRQLVLGAPVGDEGMQWIAACPSLEIVNLPRGRFTDAGLKELTRLPLLTLLRFSSPAVTDAGMQHLPEMQNLRFIHLLDVPITDDGLEPLKHCRLMESFYLDGGQCTGNGLGCLLKAHPGLHRHVNQRHLAGDEHADGH